MSFSMPISQECEVLWEDFVSQHSPSKMVVEQQALIQMLWQQSAFIHRICQKHPDWLEQLIEDNPRDVIEQLCHHATIELAQINSEDECKQQLRYLRQRGHLHICWNDLVEQQEIFYVLGQLTQLADGCVKIAADWLRKNLVNKYGEPRTEQGEVVNLVVIAMGKQGGGELNFSSDIDVMFCYSDSGQTDGKISISNQEFFTQLAQSIIRVLSEMTVDGFVYRVDCRLRPFGDSGPLVVNFNHIEDYLFTHGREWERYAYIKARVIYGLDEDKQRFDKMVSSFVYRKYIDFSVINTLREMKELIAQQVKRKGNVDNIKLGIGGIREIEFIVQFFQLVHGGHNTALQTRKILSGFEQIAYAGYLEEEEVEILLQAYIFLRRVENRLQMAEDLQTHVLPANERSRLLLAHSMAYGSAEGFESVLQAHRDAVNQVFAKIHGDEDDSAAEDDYENLWEKLTSLDENEAFDVPNMNDYKDFDHVVEKLRLLVHSPAYKHQDQEGRQRLKKFIPCFLRELKCVEAPALVIDRLYLLLQSILRRSVYLVLLYENQDVLKQLIAVVSTSPWIASHITSYPLLLDELVVRSEGDYLLTKAEIVNQFMDEILSNEALEYDAVLERVRMFKHTRELRVACADVLEKIPIMKVSDQLSWTAEVVVYGCVKYLEQSFDPYMRGNLAVIAFGKLGGIELSYGSDLDLVYICKNEGDIEQSAESKTPYVVRATKFAQRLTQMLTLQTVSGKLYEVDTRLRPDGESGPIVPQFAYVQDYYQNRAWTWEIQALVRTRCIVGSQDVKQQFDQMRQQILCQPRDTKKLAEEVVSMRAKMLQTKASKSAGVFHLKNDKGGITDIEFMVQYAILAHAFKDVALVEYSDNVRLLERLAGGGFISSSMATEITDIYCRFRNVMHRIALQDGKPEVSISEYQAEREVVRNCWNKMFGEQ